jgi:hypothetical protein
MGRRTKEELLASNYYRWLSATQELRAKKKSGTKLTADEKLLMRTIPTPEKPYVEKDAGPPLKTAKPKKPKAKIDFDKDVVWPVKGGAFLCAVFNTPYTDENCILLCDRDDCPFYGVGYFRAHGLKY